jgi:hypothetical protein
VSPIDHELDGTPVEFVLPVMLSRTAQRSVLLNTGCEPSGRQTFILDDLTQLAPDQRLRLVDIWEKVNIRVKRPEDDFIPRGASLIIDARIDGYLWLHRGSDDRWSRYLPNSKGAAINVEDVFYATPGRTITALERLSVDLDEISNDALAAMLGGAPLVDDLGDGNTLRARHVFDAYERALDLAQQLVDLVDAGTRDLSSDLFSSGYEITEDAVFLFPALGAEKPNRPAAILKEASPTAYAEARELLGQLDGVPRNTVLEKIDRVCFHWWNLYAHRADESKVRGLLRMAVANALSDVQGEKKKAAEIARYEQCRAKWIAKHGSQRLKRAALRSYRHDGVYRDERLAVELPDFVGSLGRKPTIRELVNPSAEALELEAQVLARAEGLGITEEQVRLVYAQPGQDSDWSDGAFVQIERYLGRHTVWQSVLGEKSADDDIPF